MLTNPCQQLEQHTLCNPYRYDSRATKGREVHRWKWKVPVDALQHQRQHGLCPVSYSRRSLLPHSERCAALHCTTLHLRCAALC